MLFWHWWELPNFAVKANVNQFLVKSIKSVFVVIQKYILSLRVALVWESDYFSWISCHMKCRDSQEYVSSAVEVEFNSWLIFQVLSHVVNTS